MIYYHCDHCGIDHDNGGVTIVSTLQDGKLVHPAYCGDCGALCEERDTDTDRAERGVLAARAEKAESVLRAFRKEWGKIDTHCSYYDGEIRHNPIAVGINVSIALQAQEIVGGEWVKEWEHEVHP